MAALKLVERIAGWRGEGQSDAVGKRALSGLCAQPNQPPISTRRQYATARRAAGATATNGGMRSQEWRKIPVQHGQQRQRFVPNQPPGGRTRAEPAYRANTDDLATASRSAARLAAEAAFTEPQIQKPLLQPTQVIVRRSRSASPGIKPIPGDTAARDIEPAVKSARVFRVAGSPPPATSEAASAALASTLVGDAPVQAPGSPRSRRRANDRRPGPVLHVVHALQKRPAAEPAEPRLDNLIEELAKVGPILESIQRAQAFEIRDIGSAAAWEQMSKTAERIRADLLALLNASAIPSLFRSA